MHLTAGSLPYDGHATEFRRPFHRPLLGLDPLELDAVVPRRCLVDLARYRMAAKVRSCAGTRRRGAWRCCRRLWCYLEATSFDDCLELFDLLMVTELLGKAEREATTEKVRQHPMLARALAKLAAAVEVLLEATSRDETIGIEDLWALIEAVVPRIETLMHATAVRAPDVEPNFGHGRCQAGGAPS